MIAPERTIPTQESVDPHAIALDPELQSRDATDDRVVAEYAEQMRAGVVFPPVVLYYDGDTYWCADGWHRVLAARQAEAADIDAEIRTGTRRDALRHALGANASHGVRRTSADKRRAVLLALADEEWSGCTDREIARLCAVSHTFVAQLRRPKPEPSGNVATPPSPVAAAALATPAAPPPLNALALGELVRCARELLDHAHKGAATSEELKASVEERLDTEITLGEWVAALDRGELEGRWSCSSGRVESASPRVRTAPPAPGSPIPRSEREADGGGQDLRTSPVGSAPSASLSSPSLPEDQDDPAAQGHQAALEEGGPWVDCDSCGGSGLIDDRDDCDECDGEGGWPANGPAVEIDTTTDAEGVDAAPAAAAGADVSGAERPVAPTPPKPSKPRPSALPPDDLPAPPPVEDPEEAREDAAHLRGLPPDQRAALDAYYTPDLHARACVGWLAAHVYPGQDPLRIRETSVGGGAWLRACRDQWPEARLDAIDLDPKAAGLKLADEARVGDFLTLPDLLSADLIVGNPPYRGDLVAWIDRSRELAPVVGYLLRSTFLGAARRLEWWQRRPPSDVLVVLPRPAWEGPGARPTTDRVDSLFVVWRQGGSQTRLHWLDAREGT